MTGQRPRMKSIFCFFKNKEAGPVKKRVGPVNPSPFFENKGQKKYFF
jgi:hypothetical protein